MDGYTSPNVDPELLAAWRDRIAPGGIKSVEKVDGLIKIRLDDGSKIKTDPNAVLAGTLFEKLQLPCPRAQTKKIDKHITDDARWVQADWPLVSWQGWDLQSIKDTVPYLTEPVQPVTHGELANRHEAVHDVQISNEGHVYHFYQRWDLEMLKDAFNSASLCSQGEYRKARLAMHPQNDNEAKGPNEWDAQKLPPGRKGRREPDFGFVIDNPDGLTWVFAGEIKCDYRWSPSDALTLNDKTRYLPADPASRYHTWPIRQAAQYCFQFKTPFAILRTEREALVLEFWLHKQDVVGNKVSTTLRGHYHWVPLDAGQDKASVLLATYVLGIASLSRRICIRRDGLEPGLGWEEQLLDLSMWIELAGWHRGPRPSSEARRRGSLLTPDITQQIANGRRLSIDSNFSDASDMTEIIEIRRGLSMSTVPGGAIPPPSVGFYGGGSSIAPPRVPGAMAPPAVPTPRSASMAMGPPPRSVPGLKRELPTENAEAPRFSKRLAALRASGHEGKPAEPETK